MSCGYNHHLLELSAVRKTLLVYRRISASGCTETLHTHNTDSIFFEDIALLVVFQERLSRYRHKMSAGDEVIGQKRVCKLNDSKIATGIEVVPVVNEVIYKRRRLSPNKVELIHFEEVNLGDSIAVGEIGIANNARLGVDELPVPNITVVDEESDVESVVTAADEDDESTEASMTLNKRVMRMDDSAASFHHISVDTEVSAETLDSTETDDTPLGFVPKPMRPKGGAPC